MNNKPENSGSAGSKIDASRPPILKDEERRLWVRSGGRCAICNQYLLDDESFVYRVSVGEMAHIVGWKDSVHSPRGKTSLPVDERNKAENLMLLCANHHQLIDKAPLLEDFSVERLRHQKKEHEDRIYHLTGMVRDRETAVIRMLGGIRGANVEVSREHAREVVTTASGRYARFPFARDLHGIEIDLSQMPDPEENWDAYWSMGQRIIGRELNRIRDGVQEGEVCHLSVFALSRIPLLVYLGYQLDDKVPTDIYQKQRGGAESWLWTDEEPVQFEAQQLRRSDNPDRVAVILSLSGTIHPQELPEIIDDSFHLFQIAPATGVPNRDIMRSHASLEAFTSCYHTLLSQLEVNHKQASEIHVFPAIPVSAAVVCGRGIMRDAHPALRIYDRVGSGYRYALTVNER